MYEFPTPESISVVLELRAADVRINAAQRTDTVVTVRPGNPSKPDDVAAAEQTVVEYSDRRLLVKEPRRPGLSPLAGNGTINVEIEVPAGSNLSGATASGDCCCTGALCCCNLNTGSGDVTIEHVTCDLKLATASGDAHVGRIGGSAQFNTASGDLSIREAGGDLKVNTANGDVRVEHSHGSVTARTANGDVRIGSVHGGVVLIATASGDTEIGIADGIAAWLDLQTGLGDVANGLDATDEPDSAQERAEIRVQTGFGDIKVRRVPVGDVQPAA